MLGHYEIASRMKRQNVSRKMSGVEITIDALCWARMKIGARIGVFGRIAWHRLRQWYRVSKRHVWRAFVGVVGTLVVLIGIMIIPLPGPGALIILLGLAILGTEFHWARVLNGKVKGWFQAFRARFSRKGGEIAKDIEAEKQAASVAEVAD